MLCAPIKSDFYAKLLRIHSKSSTVKQAHMPHNDSFVKQTSASSSKCGPQFGGIRVVSLQANFPQHFEVLWRTFLLGYCQTKGYWPPGCSLLALQNRALDLSLVALSAQRLALNFLAATFLCPALQRITTALTYLDV